MKRFIVGAVVAAVVATPAVASAADVTTDLPCYLPGGAMTVGGEGWTPGASWTVSGGVDGRGTVDADGLVATEGVRAPVISTQRTTPQSFSLDATDGTQTASTTFSVVNPGVVWNDKGNPRAKVRWSFAGMLPGEPIYVHVRRGSKTLKTTRAGRAGSPCGTATRKLRRLPVKPGQIRNGNYKIFVDHRKRFSLGQPQFAFQYKVSTQPRTR